MTKIRTAEEILITEMMKVNSDANVGLKMLKKNEPELFECIIKSHIEYAKQFINLAAESAEVEWVYAPDECDVNKESILKLKEMVK